MARRRRRHTVSIAAALNNLRTGQNHEAPRRHAHRRGSGEPKGANDVRPATRSVWRHAVQFSSLLSPRAMLQGSSASSCRITYEHHEESPDSEEGHGGAQHRGSRSSPSPSRTKPRVAAPARAPAVNSVQVFKQEQQNNRMPAWLNNNSKQ